MGQVEGSSLSYRNVLAEPMGAVGECCAMALETVIATSTEASGPVRVRGLSSVERARAAL
jgi:hypothetical protein